MKKLPQAARVDPAQARPPGPTPGPDPVASVPPPSVDSLRQYEELQLLYKMAPIGLALIDRELRHVRINDRLAAINGRPAAEHIGRTVYEMAPAIAPQLEKCFHRIFATGEPVLNIEIHGSPTPSLPIETDSLGQYYPVKAADGSVVAILVVVMDITEFKRKEMEQRQVFERITDAFVALDKDWRYTYLNPKAGELLGRRPADLIGRHIWREFPQAARQPARLAYEKAMTEQQPATLEEYYPAPDRWFENRIYPSPEGLTIYFHDITERKKSEALLNGQREVLEMIARGAPLDETLTALLRVIETQSAEMMSSILLLEPDGRHLRHGAAPRLPPELTRAINGQAIGPAAGSCGTAAFRREPVIVEDIATDPLWADYRALALPHGLRACWSTPIFDAGHGVLGTFAIYYRRPGRPNAQHQQLVEIATHTAAVAIGRERAEATAQQLGTRLTTTLENMDAGFFTLDRQWRFTYLNKESEHLLRRTRAELLGKVIWDEFKDAIGTDSDQQYHRAMAENCAVAFEEFYPPLGMWFEVSAYPSSDGLAVYFRNITERKQVAEKLRESDERFRQLAENINEVFWMTNPEKNQMLYVSPAYEKIWGRTCQSLYESPQQWEETIKPEDRARVRAAALLQERGTYDETYCITRPDGATRWIRDRAFPVRNAAGEVFRVAGVAEDITERRLLEEQLRQSQKMEAIGQLSGGVAHDFNNLLAVIKGYVGLLEVKGQVSPDIAGSIQQISEAADRAARLVRQLLTFSRQEPMQLAEHNLNGLVINLTKMLRRLLSENIEMLVECAPGPLPLRADEGMVEQVLLNLVVNARDAMPKGGVLRITTKAVDLDEPAARGMGPARPGAFACLMVSDTGTGITPEILPRIFEPFFTTKSEGKGTGLGLATVYGVMQQHGGWISVESEVGQGTTFRAYFPRLASAAGAKRANQLAAIMQGGHEGILLVEDEAAVLKLAEMALSGLGYRVFSARNGSDALQVWQAHKQVIELLLTDMGLPGRLTGRDLALRLRGENPKLPVIYMSGYKAENDGSDFQLHGDTNYLPKPFDVIGLAKIVRASLDRGATQAPFARPAG